jgi:hypothetical protein
MNIWILRKIVCASVIELVCASAEVNIQSK